MQEAQFARESGARAALREPISYCLRSLRRVALALVIALCSGITAGCGTSDSPRSNTTTTTTTTISATTTSPTTTSGPTTATTRSTSTNSVPGPPPTAAVTCPDGGTVPAGQTCPTPTGQPCPDGSTVPAGEGCPAPTTTPKSCPDGSTVPAGQTCGQPIQYCPDGSVIPASQHCPPMGGTASTPDTPPAAPTSNHFSENGSRFDHPSFTERRQVRTRPLVRDIG